MTRRPPQRQHKLTCWLLDTRTLWPGDDISQSAAEALQLVTPDEREQCLRKRRNIDAKMALGSALLKRLFVCKSLSIPWRNARFGRKRDPRHGKPCALLPDGRPAPIEFNVSHQNGLVALVGCMTHDLELGIDIVCVNERRDYDCKTIDEEGFDGWIDDFQEIFSHEESWDMKYNVDPFQLLDGTEIHPEDLGRQDRCCKRDQELSAVLPSGAEALFPSELLIDAKLRRFYTFWCYKEAYIKLDGEALLANWIKELEFKSVRAPLPGTPARCSTHGTWGERVTDAEVWFRHKRLDNVRMEIQSYEEDFMIGVAVKPQDLLPRTLPDFEKLHLERQVMDYAREALSPTV